MQTTPIRSPGVGAGASTRRGSVLPGLTRRPAVGTVGAPTQQTAPPWTALTNGTQTRAGG